TSESSLPICRFCPYRIFAKLLLRCPFVCILDALIQITYKYLRKEAFRNCWNKKPVNAKGLQSIDGHCNLESRPTRTRTLTDGTKNRSATITPWVYPFVPKALQIYHKFPDGKN